MAGTQDEQSAWQRLEEHAREWKRIREAEQSAWQRNPEEEKRVRQRIISACFALAYRRTTEKLAATVVLCAAQDGSALGASMVGWIITREDGEEWLGNTCAEWVDSLFRGMNRGY